ncbi:MAG: AMP-binding protein, partial [Acidobacteriota bacterium]
MNYAWTPSQELETNARVRRLFDRTGCSTTDELRQWSAQHLEEFWALVVDDLGIEFDVPFTQILDASRGNEWADWFVGGKLNLVENCLGRHARGDDADRECLVGRTELGGNTRYTFRSLHAEVLRCAAAMQRSGIEPGDRVASYMPMVVEVVVQMLATIHLGAVFIPIFSGYAPAALRERLDGAQVKLLFTAEASSRRGRPLAVLPQAREGVAAAQSVQK